MNVSTMYDDLIMVVDDEPKVLESFEMIFNSGGFDHVVTCNDSRKVLPMLEDRDLPAVILLDLIMPHIKGEEMLGLLAANHPQIPVIVVTATDDLQTAVDCIKAGAFDYLVKPVDKMRLITCVRRAVEHQQMRRENRELKKRVLSDAFVNEGAFGHIITRNNKMLSIFRYIEAVAASPEPVLITGESGVGKELVAQAVHTLSNRPGPFIAVNIAGLDDTAFSDTLFGHRKGAFTGAQTTRDGLIRTAASGTLFLDEIGDLQPPSQVKLLRVLQEREYYPLGSDLPQKSTARILAATNRDLDSVDTRADLRRDFYYRLQTHQIHLPPLRDRRDDLPLLVAHLVEKAASKLQKPAPTYPNELINLLNTYAFPGNIRELEAMIVDAVSKHRQGALSLSTFREKVLKARPVPSPEPLPHNATGIFSALQKLPTLAEANRQLIVEAMTRASNNQSIACRFLGISQPALSRRLKNALEGS